MSQDGGFVDLRLNRHGAEQEESFWPSFTDVMTVIVMIFLLAMVVLLIRNMELVNELRATMEAERRAAELARETGEEKESLAVQLIATENELSMLRMQLMRMEEKQEQQEIALDSRQRQVARLRAEEQALRNQVTELNQQSVRLQDRLERATRTLSSLEQDYSRLQERYQSANTELTGLRESNRSKEQELSDARIQLQRSDHRLATIEDEYANLKVKYDKLVKPARSPRGRYVVEVRYSKRSGEPAVAYKTPADTEFRTATREQLAAVLERLKAEHQGGLYIKIIFPKDSGLSYSEAWQFTSDLHRRYDYYFQDNPPPADSGPAADSAPAP